MINHPIACACATCVENKRTGNSAPQIPRTVPDSECARAYFADQGMTHQTIYTAAMHIEYQIWRRAWNAALEKAKCGDWTVNIDDYYMGDVFRSLDSLECKP